MGFDRFPILMIEVNTLHKLLERNFGGTAKPQ